MNEETNPVLRNYMAETVPRSQGLHQALGWIVDLKREMELLLDMVGEGVVAFDRQGCITLINRKAEEILMLEPWKAIGQPLESMFAQTGLVDVLQTGKNVYDEFRNIAGRDVVVNRAAFPCLPGGAAGPEPHRARDQVAAEETRTGGAGGGAQGTGWNPVDRPGYGRL